MGKVIVTDTYLYEVADSIREKNGSTNTYKLSQMGAAIRALSTTESPPDPMLQDKTVTPSKSVQNITADTEYDGLGTVTVNAIPNDYVITSDADASASDIVKDKTAYVNGEKITGTVTEANNMIFEGANISQNGSSLYMNVSQSSDVLLRGGTSNIEINEPLSSFGNASASDVVSGKTFTSSNGLKVTGTATLSGIDTSDATATEEDIIKDRTAYVNGEMVTGTLEEKTLLTNVVVNNSTISNDGTVSYSVANPDATFPTPDRILIKWKSSSRQVIGAQGSVQAMAKASLFGDATAEDVAEGKTFTSSAGLKIVGTAIGSSSGGGLKVTTGTITSSNVIETGLNSISYLMIRKTSTGISAKGFLEGFYIADSATTYYTYCSSYSQYMSTCSYSSATDMTIDGGIFTWAKELDASSGFMTNNEYTWIAFGA